MRFLVDAQLPARLTRLLNETGHDTLHTSQLPDGNRTTDAEVTERANRENRVVVTKDRDFRDAHLLTGSPRRLLIVATGNITNAALLALARSHLDAITAAFDEADFVELGNDQLIVHQRREN